jgi:EmrB/QacA subfamily drug resistance transporter
VTRAPIPVPATSPLEPADAALRRAAIVVATMGAFLTPFTSSAVNLALPSIGREFAVSATALGWITTANILAAAALVVPLSRLADLRGRRRVFLAGVVLFTAASLWAALAASVASLIAARAAQGVGAAAMFGTGVAILTSVLPPGERGKALGLNTAAVYLGLSLGPTLGGWLTGALGWRSVFLVNVLVGLALLAALRRLRGEWAGARGDRFDLPGALLFVAAQVALLLGLARLTSVGGAVLAAAGVAGFGLFAGRQARTPSPLLDLALLRHNVVFAMSSLAAFVNYAATSAVGFLVSLYLQLVRGLGPGEAGLVMLSQPLLMMLVSPLAGAVSDRVEPRVPASSGMGLSALGLAALALVGPATPLPWVIGALVVLGTGFGLFTSPNTNAGMGAVEPRQYGVASGFLGTMRLTGQAFSMALAMLVLGLRLGSVPAAAAPPEALVAALRVALALFAALCAVGVWPSLARGRVRPAGA